MRKDFIVALICVLITVSACSLPALMPEPTPSAVLDQLRIINLGEQPINDLVVLFPGETSTSLARRIVFGNIPAGVSSPYQPVEHGIYRYAAFEFSYNGRTIQQPVVDWVGEEPMAGSQFTYQLALDTSRFSSPLIQLVQVLVDTQ